MQLVLAQEHGDLAARRDGVDGFVAEALERRVFDDAVGHEAGGEDDQEEYEEQKATVIEPPGAGEINQPDRGRGSDGDADGERGCERGRVAGELTGDAETVAVRLDAAAAGEGMRFWRSLAKPWRANSTS